MASAAFTDAWVRYLTQFPTLLSLGSGTPPAAWKAELDAVSDGAFDPVTFTQLTLEGGNAAGSRNFAQMTLVRALYAVRAYRDPSFENPYTIAPPEPLPGVRMGHVVTFGTGGRY